MNLLRISLFGGVHIEQDGGPAQVKLTHTILGLLAYLLLFRQKTHPREVLANLFWEEYPQEKARNCLNTAVWRLRRNLESEGISSAYLISTPMGDLGFNTRSNFWLDVDQFEARVGTILSIPLRTVSEQEIQTLEDASRLYTGDLLEGYYSDWALRERERLRCCYLDCLYYLVLYFSKEGGNVKALSYGQQILNIDPLREDVHRQMMQLYIKNGQRSLAIKQYNICHQALETELGILPMPETQILYHQITDSKISSVSVNGAGSALLDQYQDIERLQVALDSVNQAKQNLEWLLEHFNKPI
jgi:DNA-binding SARP family transcriptional activator